MRAHSLLNFTQNPKAGLALLCLLYFATATWLVFRIAPQAGPNEGLHFEYVQIWRETGSLPHPAGRADERHQPPVYYTLATALSLPFEISPPNTFRRNPQFAAPHRGNHNQVVNAPTAFYAARFATVLFGLVGIVATYAAAAQLLPAAFALLAATLVAFMPNWLYQSAVVNNDVPVAAMCACVLAAGIHLIQQPQQPQKYAALGALFALALLTKANAIVVAPIIFVLAWVSFRRSTWRNALVQLFAFLVGFGVLYLPWIILNELRGDRLGLANTVPLARVIRVSPLEFGLVFPQFTRIWHSFWLDWSPGDIGAAPDLYYTIVGMSLLLMGLGWLRRNPKIILNKVVVIGLLICIGVLSYLYLITKTLLVKETNYFVPEGRWFMPVWACCAMLFAAGLGRLSMWSKWVSLSVSLMLIGSSLGLVGVYLPQLQPRATSMQLAGIPSNAFKPQLAYGQHKSFALLAAQTSSTQLGARTDVNLYWQANAKPDDDYVISAKIVLPVGKPWLQLDVQNSFPGYGNTPTFDWNSGDVYADTMTFYPQQTPLNGPTIGFLSVNVLDKTNTALPTWRNDTPEPNAIADEIILRPNAPVQIPMAYQLAQPVSFASGFDLVAVQWTQNKTETKVKLWWQANRVVSGNYIVFVHLVNAEGKLVAQSDGIPNNGLSPTRIWQMGDVIYDERTISLAETTTAALLIGAYDEQTQQRPAAFVAGQPLPNAVYEIKLSQ